MLWRETVRRLPYSSSVAFPALDEFRSEHCHVQQLASGDASHDIYPWYPESFHNLEFTHLTNSAARRAFPSPHAEWNKVETVWGMYGILRSAAVTYFRDIIVPQNGSGVERARALSIPCGVWSYLTMWGRWFMRGCNTSIVEEECTASTKSCACLSLVMMSLASASFSGISRMLRTASCITTCMIKRRSTDIRRVGAVRLPGLGNRHSLV